MDRSLRWLGAIVLPAALGCRSDPPPSVSITATPPSASATASAIAGSPALAPSAAAPSSATAIAASAAPASGPRRFVFSFEDADLPELVRLISGITGKRFLLPAKAPAIHATVVSPEPVTADEAYRTFLTILQSNGLTVVQRGPFLAILPSPGEPAGR